MVAAETRLVTLAITQAVATSFPGDPRPWRLQGDGEQRGVEQRARVRTTGRELPRETWKLLEISPDRGTNHQKITFVLFSYFYLSAVPSFFSHICLFEALWQLLLSSTMCGPHALGLGYILCTWVLVKKVVD
jgi:hypothetical protein